jgi:hypothetical protein
MSASIHFIGAEKALGVEDDFGKLRAAMVNQERTMLVTRANGGSVLVSKEAVAYIEEGQNGVPVVTSA